MVKVKNKKTGVIKEVSQQVASMYISTNEWEILEEVKENKEENKEPSFYGKNKEVK